MTCLYEKDTINSFSYKNYLMPIIEGWIYERTSKYNFTEKIYQFFVLCLLWKGSFLITYLLIFLI